MSNKLTHQPYLHGGKPTVRGVFTSEFLLSVATMASALALALTGHVEGEIALGAVTAAAGLYGVSRGLAKH